MPNITNAMPETEMPVVTTPITLTCVRCRKEHTLSVEEQLWWMNLGFALPKRCAPCRKEKRMARNKRRKENSAMRKAATDQNV